MGDASGQQVEVLLYGLGAIGACYAFWLSRSPNVRLSVCARSNYEAVKANGLTIDSHNHGKHTFHPHKVLKSPSEAHQTYDYVVCCNKAVNVENALEQLKPVVDEGRTTFAIMQNGVGNEVPFRQAFPKSTIISGVVWVGAHQPEPGFVNHRASELTELGIHPIDPSCPSELELSRLHALVDIFRQGGTNIDVPSSIATARWKKTIWNMAWNSLTALTGADVEFWLNSSPDFSVPVTRSLMLEAISVAKAIGVPDIEDSLADELIEKVRGLGKLYSSMHWDVQERRPIEVEVILGHAVREAKRTGVKTPTLDCLYSLLVTLDAWMKTDNEAQRN